MSFSVWFRQWVRSFFRLLTVGSKKHKSEAQRKKERERRLKAKYSSANRYRIKKRRRRRRSSHSVQNERLIHALFKFMATSLGILLLPFGLFDWGRKSAKARRQVKGNSSRTRSSQAKSTSSSTNARQAQSTHTGKKETVAKTNPPRTTPVRQADQSEVEHEDSKITVSSFTYTGEPINTATPPITEDKNAEPDENTPKSTPKCEKDQYIRKRMIIAGSYYCDQAVLDKLTVGTYFDLEAEPDNPHDKDAVRLVYNGEKIGYIAKQDHLAFVTCLKLKRKIYGVITGIKFEDGRTKYEYETWFDSNR